MTQETIKIQIEIPKSWLILDTDSLHSLIEFDRILRTNLKTLIKEQAIEKIMKEINLPTIDLDKGEIKKEILHLLAKQAIENLMKKDDEDDY